MEKLGVWLVGGLVIDREVVDGETVDGEVWSMMVRLLIKGLLM